MNVCSFLVTVSLLGESIYVLSYKDDDKPLTNNIFPERHMIPTPNIDKHGSHIKFPLFMHYRPRKKDLNLKKMLKRIGHDFNPFWMSIESPVNEHSELVTLSNNDKIDLRLAEDFDHVNFTFTNKNGIVVDVGDENVQVFKRWLLTHGSCQIRYEWEDLGVLFWPRWMKKGTCFNEFSCSWPIGMQCVPEESKIIKVLRWDCRMRRPKKHFKRKHLNKILNGVTKKRKSRAKRMRCKWIKVPYPVTDECFCSC